VRSVGLPDRRLAPVLRLDGAVQTTLPQGEETSVRVLALPAATVPRSLGWRNGFSDLARTEIAHRLRPNRVRLSGPQIATDATALRVWARARTDFPRGIVLHFLLPNQRFEQLTLGIVLPGRKWQLLRAPVSASLRGARLVVLDYEATQVPISFKYDPEGSIDLGPIEERRGGGWAALPTIGGWTPTTSPDGTSGVLFPKQFSRAPVRRGVRFEVNGTRLPLVHAPSGLPDPLSGFQSGPVPALAGGPVAAQAVDRLVTLVVAGKLVPLSIVGRADLFPSVVDRPHDFVVVDYDTLFAALNADQPGIVTPTEAWSFQQQRPTEATLGVTSLERQLRNDPLAAGTRSVLVVAGVIAVVLAFVGLLLATRTMLSSERLVFAEYEALGIAPTLLRRTAQLRVVVLSALGLLGGVLGGLASVRLVGAFVAVTGSASRPLPPIVATVAWAAAAVVLVALLVAVVVSVGVVAGRSLRLPAARRLRA
jgi:hypothetical protein